MKTKFVYDYARPSVTATIPIFVELDSPTMVGVLIGTRRDGDTAYAGCECIPGGFLDAKVDMKDVVYADGEGLQYPEDWDEEFEASQVREGETVKQAAVREVKEETDLYIREDDLVLFHEHSNPNTDPRCHVVNLCYYAVISLQEAEHAKAGDDLQKLEFRVVDRAYYREMAFNHREILNRGIKAYFEAKEFARYRTMYK